MPPKVAAKSSTAAAASGGTSGWTIAAIVVGVALFIALLFIVLWAAGVFDKSTTSHTSTAGGTSAQTLRPTMRLGELRAPTHLTYQEAPELEVRFGVALSPAVPLTDGNGVLHYAIEPPLPRGLRFDQLTGAIDGASASLGPPSHHRVHVSNGVGQTHTALTLRRVDAAPSFVYPWLHGQCTLVLDAPLLPPVLPERAVTAEALFAADPALPRGLQLDPRTGAISGAPCELGSERVRITARNSAGEAHATLAITVTEAVPSPPQNAAFARGAMVAVAGAPVALNVLRVEQSVAAVRFEPPLPPGLAFDDASGAIGGTPLEARALTEHRALLSNAGGQSEARLTIEVRQAAPEFAYAEPDRWLETGQTDFVMRPERAHPAGARFSVSPELPPGVTLDADSGEITGMPRRASPLTTYVVRAESLDGHSAQEVLLRLVVSENRTFQLVLDEFKADQVERLAPLVAQALGNPRSVQQVAHAMTDWTSWAIPAVVLRSAGEPLTAQTAAVARALDGQAVAWEQTEWLAPSSRNAGSFTLERGREAALELTFHGGAPTHVELEGDELPPGLEFDAFTRTLYGVPSQPGLWHVRVMGSNAGGEGALSLEIHVTD